MAAFDLDSFAAEFKEIPMEDLSVDELLAGMFMFSFASLISFVMAKFGRDYRMVLGAVRSAVTMDRSILYPARSYFSFWSDKVSLVYGKDGKIVKVIGKTKSIDGDLLGLITSLKERNMFGYVRGDKLVLVLPEFQDRKDMAKGKGYIQARRGVTTYPCSDARAERENLLCDVILKIIAKEISTNRYSDAHLFAAQGLAGATLDYLFHVGNAEISDEAIDYLFADVRALAASEKYKTEGVRPDEIGLGVGEWEDDEKAPDAALALLKKALDHFLICDISVPALCQLGVGHNRLRRMANLLSASNFRLPRTVLPSDESKDKVDIGFVRKLDDIADEKYVICEAQKSTFLSIMKFLKRDKNQFVYVWPEQGEVGEEKVAKKRKRTSRRNSGEPDVPPIIVVPPPNSLQAKYYRMVSPPPLQQAAVLLPPAPPADIPDRPVAVELL